MFSGNASASNTLSNIINFNPNIQIGSMNESDLSSKLDQKASSEALNKDSLSASVGVGVGGDGSGGMASTSANESTNGGLMDANLGLIQNGASDTVLYASIGGGLLILGGLVYALKKKKKG